jgi:5,10-methylenetetrahydromethanopterin reductase
MRIGIKIGLSDGPETTIDHLLNQAARAEQLGFHDVWMPNIFGLDAIGTLGILGYETERIGLGTAVTPVQPRHPVALAQQALTTQAAAGGRFVLGIGLSHRLVIEDMFGLSYEQPAAYMREYLEVLQPLLRGEQVAHQGERFNVNARFSVQGADPVPVVVAALGPRMLEIAGQLADGTITWMTGPRTLAEHIEPRITAAARAAGRPAARVVAGMPIVLTNNERAVRESIADRLALYGQLPSYKSMLEKEGVSSPADVALVGDETGLRQSLARLRDAGVTDLNAAIMPVEEGAWSRTLEFLAGELAG